MPSLLNRADRLNNVRCGLNLYLFINEEKRDCYDDELPKCPKPLRTYSPKMTLHNLRDFICHKSRIYGLPSISCRQHSSTGGQAQYYFDGKFRRETRKRSLGSAGVPPACFRGKYFSINSPPGRRRSQDRKRG